MIRNQTKLLIIAQSLVDAMAAFISFWVACYMVFDIIPFVNSQSFKTYEIVSILIFLTWLILSTIFSTPSRRFIGFAEEARIILYINTIGLLFITLFLFLLKIDVLSRTVYIVFALISVVTSFLIRGCIRYILEFRRIKGKNIKFALIVGGNSKTERISEYFTINPHVGVKVLGYIGEEKTSSKVKYLGNFKKIEEVFHNNIIDTVFFTIPFTDVNFKNSLRLCEEEGKEIRIALNDIDDLTKFGKSFMSFAGNSFLAIHTRMNKEFEFAAKRMLDIITSGIGLIALSPILILVTILIKLEDPQGPVFFKQTRIGLNGRKFSMYKFRSMVVNAEELKEKLKELNEMSGPAFKIKKDPRITKIGKFLRKTSIDELPQLINVFRGEMSLVGPRPPLPAEVEQYKNIYRRRLSVLPGITCIWQISGRNEIAFDEWMVLDMKYIDNWSFWLDLKILFKTLPVVLFGKGAS